MRDRKIIFVQLLWIIFHLATINTNKIAQKDESEGLEKVISAPIKKGGCEGETLDLKCPSGQKIFIKAIQVLLNSDKCQKKNPKIKCSNETYIAKAREFAKECKNKESCPLKLDDKLFGNECKGDQRYVGLVYVCSLYEIDEKNQIKYPPKVPAKKPKPQQEEREEENQDDKKPEKVISDPIKKGGCEGETLDLKCPSGQKIFIKAIQVLLNSDKCQKKNPKIKCSNETYIAKAREFAKECKNKESCPLKLDDKLFGNECKGDQRYVGLVYVCSLYEIDEKNQIKYPPKVPAKKPKPQQEEKKEEEEEGDETHEKVISDPLKRSGCEGQTLDVQCPGGQHIYIKAIQVFLNSDKCQKKNPKIKCSNETYLSKAKYLAKGCKNKESCPLKLDDKLFGNECKGDQRYVGLVYVCSLYEIDEKNQIKYPPKVPVKKPKPQQEEKEEEVDEEEKPEKVISDPIKKGGCEGETLDLKCPSGQKIFIKAIQVLLNSDKCQKKNPKIKCSNETYIAKAREFAKECKNKESCPLKLDDKLFGNECKGDQRYVGLVYVCSLYEIDEKNQIKYPPKKMAPKKLIKLIVTKPPASSSESDN